MGPVGGKGRERSEGSEDSGHINIHQQAPSDSGKVGVSTAHIISLRAGDGL